MALYGAPIWAEALTTRLRLLLRRPQKLMAVRAIRAYRTVSGAAACALAGSAPWELEASVLEQTYRCRAEARARGERPTLEELVGVRRAAKTAVQAGWEEALRSARYGERTVQALLPVLADWRKRRHGSLTYRLVQNAQGRSRYTLGPTLTILDFSLRIVSEGAKRSTRPGHAFLGVDHGSWWAV
ncbi:uncharacterized protein LOC113233939 [Hyposmocoma kahamanoa]|uniref:uncharacterized protein LOC113233939 n=1 Tax=Hyposmocoma kahamanoa TaxID=1477025 RepID=UPI000E6D727B|nr:uncharacterized protein LOC113233939 [Hyposmocoma kahamanoa]